MSGSDENAASGKSAPSEAPRAKIDYPTYYTFKALGLTGGVRGPMLAMLRTVLGADSVGDEAVTARPSSGGKYESISVSVYLRSEDERRRIYEAFHLEKSFVWYL